MKLVSFELSSPLGPCVRTGALDASGQIVDLAAACQLVLIGEGQTRTAARRVSDALLPSNMVDLIEGGDRSLDAARAALEMAAGHADRVDGQTIRHAPGAVRWLAPIPRPPLLRDFMGFETHLLN